MSDFAEPMNIDQDDSTMASPSGSSPATSGFFSVANGADHLNGLNGNGSPVPPPHKVSTETPPVPKPSIDAEAWKAAGNKFFKMRDYEKAIREYSKGRLRSTILEITRSI